MVVVVDGQSGLQVGDEEVLSWLRQKHPGKKVLLAVNKCDNTKKADLMVRHHSLLQEGRPSAPA